MTSEKDLMELQERFADFSATVCNNLPFVKNEADVCACLINSLLSKLDGAPREVSRVKQQYVVEHNNHIADYALRDKPADSSTGVLGDPLIVIEVRHKEALAKDYIPPVQLRRCVPLLPNCFVGAWTNGSEWCWFCEDYANTLNATPFLQFDVTQEDWLAPSVLEWLALLRQQYYNPDAVQLLDISRHRDLRAQLRTWWRSAIRAPSEQMLRRLWTELDTPKPSPSLADLEDVKWAWDVLHDPGLHLRPLPEGPGCCFRDQATGQWSAWKTHRFAVDVQADVAEWLVQWNHGGVGPLLERPTRRTLTHFDEANPRNAWPRVICNGSVHMYGGLSKDAMEKWLVRLANRTSDSRGNIPVLGIDFELHLP